MKLRVHAGKANPLDFTTALLGVLAMAGMEVDRRFLEWLSADERELLHAAEGLGNSQKARGSGSHSGAWRSRLEPRASRCILI